ncbi:MAG: mannitol-1-phosphate 5-dehydrogenase [Candidatus Sumerlaeia bacterium]
MKTLVQFGAGNIGRSFIGQLFARSGYEVVFVDIDERILNAMNERHAYDVVIKHPDGHDETLKIENVRAIDGRNTEAVAKVLADADLAATSVGQRALGSVLPVVAKGLQLRHERHGLRPLDIIIAENLHSAAQFFREELSSMLPPDFPLDDMAGLIETSIGKMVPIMRQEDLEKDPLWVFAEPYNRLILDKRGFKNLVPDVDGLAPMENIKAYVDRKLWIHNLGHSATAYWGYQDDPGQEYIWEVLEKELTAKKVKECMMQSAAALLREYPEEFTPETLENHVDDLISRFRNRALGDTIHRVGRDIQRKLARNDRLVGAALLCAKHGLLFDKIADAICAGMEFRKGDENGKLHPADQDFVDDIYPKGKDFILKSICGLDDKNTEDREVINCVMDQKN